MAGAIPNPGTPAPVTLDTPADQLLAGARGDADAALRQAQSMNQHLNFNAPAPRVAAGPKEIPTDQQPDEPPDDSVVVPGPPPTPKAAAPVTPTEEPSIGGFVKEQTKGMGDELLKAVPRFLLGLGRAVTALGVGAGAAVDTINSGLTGEQSTNLQDVALDHIKNSIDATFDGMLASKPDTGGFAKEVGSAAQFVPALLAGPVGGAIAFATQAGIEAATNAVDKGADAKVATLVGAIAAGVSTLQMHLPMSSPSLPTRLLKGAGLNVALTEGQRILSSQLLKWQGFKEAAKDYDPTDPNSLVSSGLLGAIFGWMAGKGKIPGVKKEDVPDLTGHAPPPDATPAPSPGGPPADATPAPPPPTWAGGGVTSEGAPVTPVDVSKPAQVISPTTPVVGVPGVDLSAKPTTPVVVPRTRFGVTGEDLSAKPTANATVADTPSPEPVADLKAQHADIFDKDTPRTGMLIPKGNEGDLKGTFTLAQKQNRTVEVEGGTLLMKTKKLADDARAALAAGEDPQKVIGRITGAGEGKSPDQTAVVQGQTPEGAVATESAVTPAEVPGKVAEVADQGKTPVVTTPVDAQARRAALAGGDRVLLHTPNGERAVVLAGPEVDGNVQVHMVGDDGELSKNTITAKASLIKGGRTEESSPAAPAPVAKKGKLKLVVGKDVKPAETVTQEQATAAPVEHPVEPKAASPEAPAKTPETESKPSKEASNVIDLQSKIDERDEALGNELIAEDERARGRRAADMLEGPVSELAHEYESWKDRVPEHERDQSNEPSIQKAIEALDKAVDSGNANDMETAVINLHDVYKTAIASMHTNHWRITEGRNATEAEIHAKGREFLRTIGGAKWLGKPEGGETKGQIIPDLDKAANNLRTTESQPKIKGGLKNRIQNVSAFARVLKAAAAQAREAGTADPAAIDRANEAAKKAERLDLKSDGAIAKGRGVGHAELDAHAKELLAAADQLQGREAPAKGPAVKETKLAARVAKVKAEKAADAATAPAAEDPAVTKARTLMKGDKIPSLKDLVNKLDMSMSDAARAREALAKEQATKNKPEATVKSAIEDVPDEVGAAREKAKQLGDMSEVSKSDKIKLDNKARNYFMADGRDAITAHRAAVEKLFRELHPNAKDETVQAFLHVLDNARSEARGEVPRDPTKEIEEELGMNKSSSDLSQLSKNDFDKMERGPPKSSADKLRDANAVRGYNGMHEGLSKTRFYDKLLQARSYGRTLKLHDLLDQMIEHSSGAMGGLLRVLRKFVENRDVHFVNETQAGGNAAGLYMGGPRGDRSIEIKYNGGTDNSARLLHVITHEAVHAATSDFMRRFPNHVLTKEIERLHGLARQRVNQLIEEARANGVAIRDEDLYGLKSPSEYVAELWSNPNFVSLIGRSGKFAFAAERLRQISSKFIDTVAKMLNLRDRNQIDLVANSYETIGNIMKAQREATDRGYLEHGYDRPVPIRSDDDRPAFMPDANKVGGTDYRPPSVSDVADLQRYRDNHADGVILDFMRHGDERPLTNEEKIRGVVGARATRVVSDTLIRTKSFYEAVRDKVMPVKAGDQLIRDGLVHFGSRDDPTNPLRKLDEAGTMGKEITERIMARATPLVARWSRLSIKDNKTLGEFMKDSTIWGIDPTVPKDKHAAATQKMPKFDERYDEYQRRWDNMRDPNAAPGAPHEMQKLYKDVRDTNEWAGRQIRNAGIDMALRAFSDTEVSQQRRQLLYSVKRPGDYDSLIGKGKLIDVGDRNEELTKGLNTLAGLNMREGPYFHLGRNGKYVVQINPEGTKSGFKTAEAAEAHAEEIRNLSPESEATVSQNPDGTHNVDYKIDYVSMHEKKAHAEAEVEALRDKGFDVGVVTRKVTERNSAPLTAGAEQIVAHATRRLNRSGPEGENKPLIDALHSTIVQMMAARSSYAGSRLMRKGSGGVKGEEMLRNFADHTQSLAWSAGQLKSVFAKGEALGEVHRATRDNTVPQHTAYERGRVTDQIDARLKQETAQYGLKSPLNSFTAKLGFANYLASPSHAFIWSTQNFTTAMPAAGARWGYARSYSTFGRAMATVAGPAFRSTILAHMRPGSMGANDITNAVIEAVRNDKHFGKWAQGENSHLKQIMDRGAISSSFSQELAHAAGGSDWHLTNRVFEYARLLPHLADTFNRISTALAGLELTNGDVYKAADFVRETHMDYSAGNKPLLFKRLNSVPGGNSLTMFRTYTQGMAHLIYSNIHALAGRDGKSPAEAAKTLAGVILSTSVLAGVTAGAVLEPARLAIYAWNKIMGDSDEFFDLNNSIDNFMKDQLGDKAGEAVSRGLPRVAGMDLSSRMGLGDLFFHDMPDLFSAQASHWADFALALAGPSMNYPRTAIPAFIKHWEDGEYWQALGAVVPIKMVQDAQKAADLATTGKQNDKGATVEPPSVGGALTRLAGFKPAAEAEEQERSRVAYEYQQATANRRAELLRQVAKFGYGEVSGKIQAFNQKHQSNPITFRDFQRQRTAAQRAEAISAGQPVKDRNLNNLID